MRLPVVLGALGAALGGLAVVAFLVFVFGMRHYRVPSSAMEPTLHCARRGLGCEAGSSDRILVPRLGWFQHVERGDIVVFRAPPLARQRCGG